MSFNTFFHSADPDAVGNFNEDEPPGIGEFDVSLAEARAFTSKAGKDTVVLRWKLIDQDHSWPSLLGFGSQGAANFAVAEIRALGIDQSRYSSLDELNTELQRVVGIYYTVEVVESESGGRTYLNTYVRGRAGDGTRTDVPVSTDDFAPVAAGGSQAFDDDDIPF